MFCLQNRILHNEQEFTLSPPRPPARRSGPEKPDYSRAVPAVAQASKLLFSLARPERSQHSLTELCREVGIHKSKGYSILNTLMEFGLVVRSEGSKTYALGPGLLVLSRSLLDQSDLRSGVGPFLEKLSKATRCTALLGLVNADQLLVVGKHEPDSGVPVAIRVGHRYPLTWGAHGKALVASLDADERRRVLAAEKLYFWGDPPPAEPDTEQLVRELEACRAAGFATDLGGMQAGVCAASSPVLGSGSRPIGAVMAVGTFPPSEASTVGSRVADVSRELSSLLGPTLESLYAPR